MEDEWDVELEGEGGAKPGKMMHDKIKWSTGISLGFTISDRWRESQFCGVTHGS